MKAKIDTSVFGQRLVYASYLYPLLVAVGFAWGAGIETQPVWWPAYALLAPLLLYLGYFLSYFKRHHSSARDRHRSRFRAFCLIAFIVVVTDAWGAWLNRAVFHLRVQMDERYNLVINEWINRQRFRLPPASGFISLGPYMPNSSGTIANATVHVDRWGFRRETEDPYSGRAHHETLNVLCLGGSVLFGMTPQNGQLPIPDLLQSQLLDQSALPFRVYNAAFPGQHDEQALEGLRASYHRLPPDVIVFYEAINRLAPGQKGFLLRRNSLLASWGLNAWQRWQSARAVALYDPVAYRENLQALIQEAREYNPHAMVVLVAFPLPYEMDDPWLTRSYWDAMQNGQGSAYAAARLVEKHNRVLQTLADSTRALLADPRPQLQGSAQFFIDACHLSPEGNRIVAEQIAALILKRAEPEWRNLE